MKNSKYLLFTLLLIYICHGCRPAFEHEITIDELKTTIRYMASDSLKGRFPGTPEDSAVTAFICRQMEMSGMELHEGTGLQRVTLERGFSVTVNNRIILRDNQSTVIDNRFLKVPGFSATDSITGEIIISAVVPAKESAGIYGNILMLPLPTDLPAAAHDAYLHLRSLSLKALDIGVAGIIFVSDFPFPSMESHKRLPLSIPVALLPARVAAGILRFKADDQLFGMIDSFNEVTVATGISVTMETEVFTNELTSYNTIATLPGSDPGLSGQYMLIGAHHDHLGMGGRGSSSRWQDTVAVHYGADDNASGVAGVIELSQHLSGRNPGRSILFTTFAGEEAGLVGSKSFVENPAVDLDKVQAMINLDMLGRLNGERQLQIGGIGTSPVFREMIDSLNGSYEFEIAYAESGYGPSDHASFYAADIPVLFISTGAHTDYHTPDDSPEKINYEGLQEVLYFVSDIASTLANLPDKITFTMAGPKESSGSRGREGMVTFGLMPDVMYDGDEGMPVSFVTEGRPAAVGGMKGGDIITAVDGKRIGNVHDYMERLSDLSVGQSVVVSIIRDGKKIELLLKL
ncbi:MAG: M28 family peptidase [Bacteroidales bacterium]